MDLIKIDALNSQVWQLRYQDMPTAFELSKQVLENAKKLNYEKGIAYAKLNHAFCCFFLSKEERILESLLEVLNFFEKNNEEAGYARCLYTLGNVYEHHGDYDNGLKFCMKGLTVAENLGLKEEQGDALSVMGLIYSRLSDYDNAIENYKLSLAIREEIHDQKAAASSLNLIARSYSLKNDFTTAIEFYRKSLDVRNAMNDYGGLPWTYIGLASLYEKINDNTKAIEHYNLSLNSNATINDKRCDLYCNMGLGRIFSKRKEITALAYIDKAYEIALYVNAKPLIYEVLQAYSEYYEMLGEFAKSLEYYKKFNNLKEEVLNHDTHNKIKQQQINFAIERSQKEAEIYQLRNVELKAAFDEISYKNKNILASIRYALRIQNAIIPSDAIIKNYFPDSYVLYKPRDIVSGDFYWFEEHDNLIFFSVVDCTGHGVPGAFMSIMGYNILNQAVFEKKLKSPSDILNYLCREIFYHLRKKDCGDLVQDGMDLMLCVYDENDKTLEFSGVHNPLYLIRNNELTVFKSDAHSIGEPFDDEFSGYASNNITIQKNDVIYLFSDGFADQFGGPERKKFMSKRFKQTLIDISLLPMENQKQKLESVFDDWLGNSEQMDDVTVMGVRFTK